MIEVTLKLSEDQVDEFFVEQLKETYDTACGADSEEAVRLACLILLEYCMISSEYKAWRLENE
jgi:hypothetical protein